MTTRKHSSRMHTACFSRFGYMLGSQPPPFPVHAGKPTPPLSQYMLGSQPLSPFPVYAGKPTPTVNRMTHRCKNIILPQTSLVGGKNDWWNFPFEGCFYQVRISDRGCIFYQITTVNAVII